jgi:hypothetical protein
MKLQSVTYVQNQGEADEWAIRDLTLQDINLVVGTNASGKSKSLTLIVSLARLLTGEFKLVFRSGEYDVRFEDGGKQHRYVLVFRDFRVVREEFDYDGRRVLTRGVGGVGTVFAERPGDMLEFQAPDTDLAAVVRRDSIQHPFFESLHQWGKSVYHIAFGTSLGKETIGVLVQEKQPEVDPRETSQTGRIYRAGEKTFGDVYKEAVIRDMTRLGYPVSEVGMKRPSNVQLTPSPPGDLMSLYVKETSLMSPTDQFDMSQGMFRAFAVIVQLNYFAMSRKSGCFLIDDIGEGLDFARSCALIEFLIEKAHTLPMQLIMTTNDRFVMNKVPLDAWSIVRREGSAIRVYNSRNAPKAFEDFKFTGLNNFDFLATDFLDNVAAG